MPNPSIIQKAWEQSLDPDYTPFADFPGAVTAGHYLIAVAKWRDTTGPTPTISDSRGNVWAPIYLFTTQAVWIATAKDSGACRVTADYLAPEFSFNSDLLILEVDSAGATVSSNSNSGNSNTASISNAGLSVSQQLWGYPYSSVEWTTAMINFIAADGLAADGLTIAVFMSDAGFRPVGLPSGWTDVFAGSGFGSTYTEVLVGPGATGTPPPPIPGAPGECPAACQTNLSDVNPPAPGDGLNVRWQKSDPYLDPHNPQESIRDVSAYVAKATPNTYGVVLAGGNSPLIEVNQVPVSNDLVVFVNQTFDVNGTQLLP